MMDAISGVSRRDLILGWGTGALAAGLADWRAAVAQPIPATGPTVTQPIPVTGPTLIVGDVEISSVIVKPLSMGSPNLGMDNGFCKVLSGGINFVATIELGPRAGANPAWWGELMLVQHVQFRHQHTLAKTGKRECASSGGGWNLDGQDPYQNKRVSCAPTRPGPIGHAVSIKHADDPGTFAEDAKKGPFEEVDVRPLDRFRTYVIWETTDNSQRPIGRNLARRHVLARVDWDWKAVALDPPVGQPQCTSTPKHFAPNAWGAQDVGSDVKVFLGKDAVTDPQLPGRPIMPPPGARLPPAMPEVWRPGTC